METIVGIGLALLLGIWIGYMWRDHISQRRRTEYLAELRERESRAHERTARNVAVRDLQ